MSKVQLRNFEGSQSIQFLLRRELNSNVISSWNPFINNGINHAKNFYRKNLTAHFGCVNAIEFSNDGKWLASGGDDRRVLLWDVHKAIHGTKHQPLIMQAEHASNVFAIASDRSNTKLFSGGNDDQVIVHDIQTRAPLDCFMHEQPVFGLSVDPINDCIFASACDSGRVCIYDIRDSNADPFCLASSTSAFHSVMFSPTEPRLVVTANSKKGVALFDVRYPKKCLLKYGGNNSDQCCMSAKFSADGRRIFALRRRLPPVLYATESSNHLFQFNHMGYYNSCTMKSCSFAGENDEFVLSGSDNFDLYVWKIPTPDPPIDSHKRFVQSAHLVLKGHRSIVNQVRYNPTYSVIASSGVEKLIKLFSPFPLLSTQGRSYLELPNEKERKIYSHDDYINLVMQSGQFSSLTFDTSRRNTKEDPRMMAFFDALIQRDIEGMDEEDNELARQRVSYTNTAFSFSSIFSDESRSASHSNEQSEHSEGGSVRSAASSRRSLVVNFQSQDYNNIQIVQSPRLISDESDNEINMVPINIVRENLPQNDENSIELELVPNEALSNEQPQSVATIAAGENENFLESNDTDRDVNISAPTDEHSNSSTSSDSDTVTKLNKAIPDPDSELIQTSTPPQPKREENIITKMISKRQDRLLQMARNHIMLEAEGRQARRRSQRERDSRVQRNLTNPDLTPVPCPYKSKVVEQNKSSSSSSTSSSSSSSSESDSSDSDSKQLKELRKKIRPLLWRNKKRVLQSTSDSDSETAASSITAKRKKLLKSNRNPLPNKKCGASQETLTKLKMYLNSLKDSRAQSVDAEVPQRNTNNNNEPCTSASVLLRDAIAAGLTQSNVIYENDESSLNSSSSSSTTTSDSSLERLVMDEIKPKPRHQAAKSAKQNGDATEEIKRENFSTNGYGKQVGRKRAACSSSNTSNNHVEMNNSNNLTANGTNKDSDCDITNLLQIKKSEYLKKTNGHNKRQKTLHSSSSDEESTSLVSDKGSSSLSFATPDSGIESSRNERDFILQGIIDHQIHNNDNNNGISTDQQPQLELDVENNEEPKPVETTFKKLDQRKTKQRNYRQHDENENGE